MIVLDTTVLVYAVGADHPLRAPCQELVRAIADGEITATTTVEVIQEFAHVRARRRDRADAALHAADFADLLSPLIEVRESTLRAGLRRFADARQVGAFDAVLASAAADASHAEVGTVVSADRAFAELPGIRHVFPDADGIAALLSA
ncbi:MAG: type II toxin-antitoxin system VapC family toxin [Solirubrobacteraceae bacterium]|nr:type II toxin-antitoxin system VapC family toxin [Solirubrobacteraceae bacterium]